MDSKLNETIVKDLKKLGVLTLLIIIVFKIVFYNELILTLIWAVISFILTFTIPGLVITYLWYEKFNFTERFIVGNMMGLISVGILSYSLSSYLGIHIRILAIIAPIIVTLAYGIIVYYLKIRKKESK